MRRILTSVALVALLLNSTAARSADFENGLDAFLKEDYATALNEFLPLAEQGHAEAQYYLGAMYYTGDGVPKGYETAVKWYKLAAEQGNVDAQTNLGEMYRQGTGVRRNYEAAVNYFKLSAEQGHVFAQISLGELYFAGAGVTRDYVRAHVWFNIAASKDDGLGAEYRDMIAAAMTPADLERAKELAEECMNRNYKGC